MSENLIGAALLGVEDIFTAALLWKEVKKEDEMNSIDPWGGI